MSSHERALRALEMLDSKKGILPEGFDVNKESGFYSDEKVSGYLDGLRASVESFREEDLEALPAHICVSLRRTHSSELAAYNYCQQLGVTELAGEARRLEALLFSLEKSGMSKGDRVAKFVQDCGGLEHFRFIFRGLQCAGPLHDIATTLASTKRNLSLLEGLADSPELVSAWRGKFQMLLTEIVS